MKKFVFKNKKVMMIIFISAFLLLIIANGIQGYLYYKKDIAYKNQLEIVNNELNCPICPLKLKCAEATSVSEAPVIVSPDPTPTPIVETPTPVVATLTPVKATPKKVTATKTPTPAPVSTPVPTPTPEAVEEVIAPPPPPS